MSKTRQPSSLRASASASLTTAPRGVLLPLGHYDLFTVAAGPLTLPVGATPTGRALVEVVQTASGAQIRETWVMFDAYRAPGSRNSLFLRPRTGPAPDRSSLLSALAADPACAGSVISTWQLPDPRVQPEPPKQIDAGSVEIVARGPAVPGGTLRVGTVRVTAPAGYAGSWTPSQVAATSGWEEIWFALPAPPDFEELRFSAAPPADLNAWIAAHSGLVSATWTASYQLLGQGGASIRTATPDRLATR